MTELTPADFENYNNIVQLIADNDIATISSCIRVHTLAPIDRQQPVFEAILKSKNTSLAAVIFPHLHWQAERYKMEAVIAENDAKLATEFFKYCPVYTDHWNVLNKIIHYKSFNVLDSVLEHKPNSDVVDKAIWTCSQLNEGKRVQKVLHKLIQYQIDQNNDLFPSAVITAKHGYDFSDIIAPLLPQNKLSELLFTLSEYYNNRNFELAYIQRGYVTHCANITFDPNNNQGSNSSFRNTTKSIQDKTFFHSLLMGAIHLNDFDYYKDLLRKTEIEFPTENISLHFKYPNFFMEAFSFITNDAERMDVFKKSLYKKEIDIALAIYNSGLCTFDIKEMINLDQDKSVQSVKNDYWFKEHEQAITELNERIVRQRLMFDALSSNPQASSKKNRKI